MYPYGISHSFLKHAGSVTASLMRCGQVTRDAQSCERTHVIPTACRAESMDVKIDRNCHKNHLEAKKCIIDQGSCQKQNMHPNTKIFWELLHTCYNFDFRQIQKCVETFIPSCEFKRIRVTKVNRLSMQAMEQIIRHSPDLFVVFFIRDPRAIWLSRLDRVSMEVPISALCEQIRTDYAIYTDLADKFPGVFIKIKYEELAGDTEKVSRKMYSHFGEEASENILTFINEQPVKKRKQERPFETLRSDSNKTAYAWRDKITSEQMKLATKACGDLIQLLGYTV